MDAFVGTPELLANLFHGAGLRDLGPLLGVSKGMKSASGQRVSHDTWKIPSNLLEDYKQLAPLDKIRKALQHHPDEVQHKCWKEVPAEEKEDGSSQKKTDYVPRVLDFDHCDEYPYSEWRRLHSNTDARVSVRKWAETVPGRPREPNDDDDDDLPNVKTEFDGFFFDTKLLLQQNGLGNLFPLGDDDDDDSSDEEEDEDGAGAPPPTKRARTSIASHSSSALSVEVRLRQGAVVQIDREKIPERFAENFFGLPAANPDFEFASYLSESRWEGLTLRSPFHKRLPFGKMLEVKTGEVVCMYKMPAWKAVPGVRRRGTSTSGSAMTTEASIREDPDRMIPVYVVKFLGIDPVEWMDEHGREAVPDAFLKRARFGPLPRREFYVDVPAQYLRFKVGLRWNRLGNLENDGTTT